MGSIPHSFGEALPLLPHNVTIFGDGDFKEVTKVKWALIQSDRYPHKKRRLGHTKRHQTCVCEEERLCEHTEKRQPPASHREKLQKKPSLLAPGSQTSSHQHCEKIFLWFKPPSLWYIATAALADECTRVIPKSVQKNSIFPPCLKFWSFPRPFLFLKKILTFFILSIQKSCCL